MRRVDTYTYGEQAPRSDPLRGRRRPASEPWVLRRLATQHEEFDSTYGAATVLSAELVSTCFLLGPHPLPPAQNGVTTLLTMLQFVCALAAHPVAIVPRPFVFVPAMSTLGTVVRSRTLCSTFREPPDQSHEIQPRSRRTGRCV